MENKSYEYTTNDFSAVDQHVKELAKRERILTWRLFIDNLKRLGIPLIFIACALAILLIALGIFIWLIKSEKVKELEKVVEITKEVPVEKEKLKIIEIPKYIAVPMTSADLQFDGVRYSDQISREQIKTALIQSGVEPSEVLIERIWQSVREGSSSNNSVDQNNADERQIETGENVKTSDMSSLKDDRKDFSERIERSGGSTVGAVRFSLKWNNTNDLDLHVQAPGGKKIWYRNKRVSGEGGGNLDIDTNFMDANVTSRPIENIIFPSGLEGTYKVFVSIYNDRTRQPNGSTKYKLEVAVDGQKSQTYNGLIPNNTPKNKAIFALNVPFKKTN